MYWNPDTAGLSPESVDLLEELRLYRQSNEQMRVKVRDDMGLGDKDLETLRLVLDAHHEGKYLRQQDLAHRLHITGASVSALVDRLANRGFLTRQRHPDDRRSVALMPTAKTTGEVEATLRSMQVRMLDATEQLSADHKLVVLGFLKTLNGTSGRGEE
ncbi:MAG: MarR family transcriptional regulator [Arthrobacter sp.]|jgi:DNA-binding MarR family transcriptional regulator|nr:MarR family transcriptional regulator [Arthrobacter sp.]